MLKFLFTAVLVIPNVSLSSKKIDILCFSRALRPKANHNTWIHVIIINIWGEYRKHLHMLFSVANICFVQKVILERK